MPLRPRQLKWKIDKNDCWNVTSHGTNSHGYVGIQRKKIRCGAHRAIWEKYNGSIPKGMCVLHKCDNRICVNPEHLFMGTKKDNNIDRTRKGRSAKGEKNGNNKLTRKQIKEIRQKHIKGINQYNPGNIMELAIKYKVNRSHIWRIINCKAWT